MTRLKPLAEKGIWYWIDANGSPHRANLSKKEAQNIIDTMFLVRKANKP